MEIFEGMEQIRPDTSRGVTIDILCDFIWFRLVLPFDFDDLGKENHNISTLYSASRNS